MFFVNDFVVDIPTALSAAEGCDKLGLHNIEQEWFLSPCCMISGEGFSSNLTGDAKLS